MTVCFMLATPFFLNIGYNFLMKLFSFILVLCISYLQYAHYFDSQGIPTLNRIISATDEANLRKQALAEENKRLELEIRDLTTGYAVIEELARKKMGMVKDGEIFFRVYPIDNQNIKLGY